MLGGSVGPLHGLPVTIKDAIATEGIRSTGGAKELADYVPTEDAPAVARLKAAGAIVFGKTNLPQWSGDVQTYNELFGVTNNPWAFDRITGGSSGGVGRRGRRRVHELRARHRHRRLGADPVALLRRLRAQAHVGRDPTARLPRPSRTGGTIDVDINVFGPIARSAEDLDLLLSVLAGPEPERAVAWRLELPPAEERSLGDLDVGVWFDEEGVVIDSEYATMLRAAADRLADAGMRVHDRHPDGGVRGAERASSDDDRRRHGTDAADGGPTSTTSAPRTSRWLRGEMQRHDLRQVWHRWFEHHDLLLCPVMATPAFPHDHTGTIMDRTVEVDGTTRGHIELISWLGFIGVLGLPSVVVPIGRTAAGLPVGHADRRPLVPRLPRHPRRGADDRRARRLRVAAGVLSRISPGCRGRGGGAPFPARTWSRMVSSLSTSWNSGWVSTASRSLPTAVTVAFRGAGSNSASSPKKSPRSIVATSSPPRVIARLPLEDHEEVAPLRALADDVLAVEVLADPRDPRDPDQLVTGARLEDRHLGEAHLDVVDLCRARPRPVRRSGQFELLDRRRSIVALYSALVGGEQETLIVR